jgi:hypothetical protein
MFFELNQHSVGPDPPDTGVTDPRDRFEPASRSFKVSGKKSTAQGLNAQSPNRGFAAVPQAMAGRRLHRNRS